MADRGPFLILAAFWTETDDTDAVAHAVRRKRFPAPTGFPRGAVVSFRYETADNPAFRRDLAHFDLAELNARPNDGR